VAVDNKFIKRHRFVRNNKEMENKQDELHRINNSEDNAVKQKFFPCFTMSKGFKVMYKISSVLVREDLDDSEDLIDFSVSDIVHSFIHFHFIDPILSGMAGYKTCRIQIHND
jgi:hypothetical protein